MNSVSMKPGRPAGQDEQVRSLVRLIDDLVTVVIDENNELARGLPASRLKQVAEKERLGLLFEQRVTACVGSAGTLSVRDKELREQLMIRIMRLRAAMDENVVRLRAAIEASSRRIETVMQAIREQITDQSPYGASGRRMTRSSSSGATNVSA